MNQSNRKVKVEEGKKLADEYGIKFLNALLKIILMLMKCVIHY